jgi:hypothetical protein
MPHRPRLRRQLLLKRLLRQNLPPVPMRGLWRLIR